MAGLRTLDGRRDDHDLDCRHRMAHRIEKTAKISTRGNLRIGDHWNAITIIALSQSNPLKAVAELVENSIDARAKTIVITRGREKGQHYLRVKDDGIGIAEEFHEDIFRIFKRLNAEDDDKKGTGVGLTFVRKIVERHGGRIWLESEPGKGSVFYFTIEPGRASETAD